jgi:GT2 family glycosyltransferase
LVAESRPLITLSIVSHAHGGVVQRLLDSLAEHEGQLSLEIIITQNIPEDLEYKPAGSGQHSFSLVRNVSAQGFAANHNEALRNARGEYFCVLNPDVVFVEPVFESLLHHLETEVGHIVAPLVYDLKGNLQDNFRSIPTLIELFQRWLFRRKPRLRSFEPGEIIRPEWIAATFLLMSAATFKRLGGFDERYYLYFEDVDLCSRARTEGLQLAVDTNCRVVHEARRESYSNLRFTLLHVQSAWKFFRSPINRDIRDLP